MSDALHVFVLVDGLGWRILDRVPWLEDLLPHRQPLRTVLGYSSGAIPTLLTGQPPARHGHWNLFYYDPERSPFRWLRGARFLPAALVDNRVSRRLVKEVGRRLLGLGPLFDCAVPPSLLPWFDWVEKRSLYEQDGVRGARSIFDELAAAGVPFRAYSYHRFSDAEILARARHEIGTSPARVFFLYLSELDALLHAHVTDQDVVAARLAWYEEGLRALLQAARARDRKARFALFSDHGMTPVSAHHDLAKEVDRLGLRAPRDYVAVYDSTMARFWFFRETARRAITERMGELRGARILDDAALSALGILFPDRRYGELIVLLEPGAIIASSGFNGARWRPAGMHGYHPDDPDSDGVFLSSVPPGTPVKALADVHATLREVVA